MKLSTIASSWCLGFALVGVACSSGSGSTGTSGGGGNVGSYSCTNDGPYTGITYTDGAGSSYGATNTLGSCTIDVTTYGAVGELMGGTFTAKLEKGAGPGPSTVSITGSFSIIKSK